MKRGLKRLLIWVCITAGIAVAGVFGYRRYNSSKTVEVQPLRNYLLYYNPNQNWMYGVVISGESQQVYYDKEEILEICVSEGQEVSVGDPLVRYDTTSAELELEEKQLELRELERTLEQDYVSYRRSAGHPYEDALLTPTPKPTPKAKLANEAGRGYRTVRLVNGVRAGSGIRRAVWNNGSGTVTDPYRYEVSGKEQIPVTVIGELTQKAETAGHSVYGLMEAEHWEMLLFAGSDGSLQATLRGERMDKTKPELSEPKRGTGSRSNPYFYPYASGTEIPAALFADLNSRAENRKEAVYAELKSESLDLKLTVIPEQGIALSVAVIEPTPSPTPTPSPSESPLPTDTPYYGGGMSHAEWEEMLAQMADSIKENERKYQTLLIDIAKLKMEGTDGVLYATVSGTVTQLKEKDGLKSGDVLLTVTGNGGIRIAAVVAETALQNYPVGTELTGFSYTIGEQIAVRVTEISAMPVTTSYYNGGNSNSSGYLLTMEVVGNQSLKVYDYIEFSDYRSLVDMGEFYLMKAFLEEKNGQTWVYVERDGVLRREQVTTGRVISGYAELIDSGLTGDDWIAFPGDPFAKEGIATEHATGYMRY